MATNPSITPFAGTQDPYVVGASDVALFDVEVSNLTDGAEVIITAPAGSEVHAWGLTGGEATVRWNGAGIATALLTGGSWVANPTVGTWQLAVPGAETATDPALVTITAPAPTGGPLRIRVTGIRTSGPSATATVQAQANAEMRRVVADPSIVGSPGPALTPVVEMTSGVTLVGTAAVSYQESAVPESFGGHPPVRGTWERTTSVLAFMLTPSGTMNATFNAPGVYQATVESFLFRAYYDVDASSTFDTSEPDNTEDVNVSIQPKNHRMVLVLDRSGSMFGTLPAGSESKWVASTRAAHIWLDLFAALRPTTGQTAGFVTFEDDTCGYGACATSDDVTFRDPSTGMAATGLSSLSTWANLNTLDLGTPQSCTPIGDALVKACQALTVPPLTDLDHCTIVLFTDGRENSGCVSLKHPAPAGATRSFQTALSTDFTQLSGRLSVYAIGAGDSVDEDSLNGLPALAALGAPGNAYYRLLHDTGDLMTSFAEMIGHSIDAQNLNAMINNAAPGGAGAFFTTNAGEQRIVVTVPWTNSADTLQLSHRVQGSADSWTIAPISVPSGTTLWKRTTHATLVANLAQALAGIPSTARDWRVQHLSGGSPQALTDVLAMVDLHVKMTLSFDETVYRTSETIIVSCSLVEGKDPITGATIVVSAAAPGKGLGTYMAQHGSKFGGQTPTTHLKDSQLSSALARSADKQGGDPDALMAAVFTHFLAVDEIQALPRVNAVFSDGTDQVYDDGSHGDGRAGDGIYANGFDRTDKEGTYTFRAVARFVLADGSVGERVITKSIWVGVDVDPASSPVSVVALANPPASMVGTVISLTPKTSKGEFLGPFREPQVQIEASGGTFTGPVESRLDGSYARTVLYQRGEDPPTLTVTVNGRPIDVRLASVDSCWRMLLQAIVCLLRKLAFWRRRR